MKSLPFKTRARTVDHLGREQIADCPTAISELWKNAYDAYARNVALHIFDGNTPVAAILDDGHGMTAEEFIDRWLVIGTESKVSASKLSLDDRNGLKVRNRQGQKGIGRLSCAYLGSLCLIVSKRKTSSFVAALIDWRLFENPFLILQDVTIPVVEFTNKDEIFRHLPDMFDALMSNVWGSDKDKSWKERLTAAWDAYDDLEKSEKRASTREAIENTIIDTTFSDRHLEKWPVWSGEASAGTAIIMSDINFDLMAQLRTSDASEPEAGAQDKLRDTLSSFVDPFRDNDTSTVSDFTYSVTAWNGLLQRSIVSPEREFNLRDLSDLEHIVDGHVDKLGVFKGRVKAFGTWLEGECTAVPNTDVPTRANTIVGPFNIVLGTIEQDPKNTTLSKGEHAILLEKADLYGGFKVYRDDLRVMPYGREGNDFFEIEARRGKHAGREYWASRRIFGRIALTRDGNPNLKDKAGREGIIDNQASKVFRQIVVNILMDMARRYFGTASDLRQTLLPEIQAKNKTEKAKEDQKKRRQKRRKNFNANLKRLAPEIDLFVEEIDGLVAEISSDVNGIDEALLLDLRTRVSAISNRKSEFVLGEAPSDLGSSQERYDDYVSKYRYALEQTGLLNNSVSEALKKTKLKEPRDVARSELNANEAHLQKRVRDWSNQATTLLKGEVKRINGLKEERFKSYHAAVLHLLDDVEYDRMPLDVALNQLDLEREKQDQENADLFGPYVSALESLKESIDLEGIASFGENELSELRAELDRLNALAQLGITVEIIGHEIESLDATVTSGLRAFPNDIKTTDAYKSVKTAQEMLTDRWRFLSPMKLSANRSRELITGDHIHDYVVNFFGDTFKRNEIRFECSASFERFAVQEYTSRIFPVFLNLVNNARHWVCQSNGSERRILLDVHEGKVIVADDGPGVDKADLNHLFTLFFTRKSHGGRGVGLYLCRANLSAGGHSIEYASKPEFKRLSGANFVIDFKGAEFD